MPSIMTACQLFSRQGCLTGQSTKVPPLAGGACSAMPKSTRLEMIPASQRPQQCPVNTDITISGKIASAPSPEEFMLSWFCSCPAWTRDQAVRFNCSFTYTTTNTLLVCQPLDGCMLAACCYIHLNDLFSFPAVPGRRCYTLTSTSVPSPRLFNSASLEETGSVPSPRSFVLLACWGDTVRHFLSCAVSDPCREVPEVCTKEALDGESCSTKEAFSGRDCAEPSWLEERSVNLASELSVGTFCRSRSAAVWCVGGLRAGREPLDSPQGSLEVRVVETAESEGEERWEALSKTEEIWAGTESTDSPYRDIVLTETSRHTWNIWSWDKSTRTLPAVGEVTSIACKQRTRKQLITVHSSVFLRRTVLEPTVS